LGKVKPELGIGKLDCNLGHPCLQHTRAGRLKLNTNARTASVEGGLKSVPHDCNPPDKVADKPGVKRRAKYKRPNGER